MTVEDRDLGWKNIVKNLKILNKGYTKVGVQEGVINEKSDNKDITIADYAIWNEFGTSTIPSRPFMRTAYDKNKAKLINIVDRKYSNVLAGENARIALGLIGEFFQTKVTQSIDNGSWVPNAPSTIARKRNPNPTKAQKAESPKVLKDTGSLINNITHVEVFK